ncbi:MAG: hypothetical protein AAF984_10795 [Verrucomicrobiota bacterium]
MKLSAPKFIVWLIALLIGVAGFLEYFSVIRTPLSAFWMVGSGFIVLILATVFKDL